MDKAMTITEEMIKVMQAYVDGKKIESRKFNSSNWCEIEDGCPSWSWGTYDYRVKPTGAFATPDEGLVGGMIFNIDTDSDEEVVFFDENGETIENVFVGDTPYMYKITKKSSKSKYWVFSHKVSKPLQWKPSGAESKTFGTSYDFGTGCANTEKVLADKSYTKRKETIWNYLVELRVKTGICDWFVPSQKEMELLMGFFAIHEDDLKLINPFNMAWLWTSSEDKKYSAQNARNWGYYSQSFGNYDKNYNLSLCAVRDF